MVRKIKELCKSRKMSLRDLEKELQFGCRTVEQWDVHSPSVKKVLKVAKYSGVKIEDLMEKEVQQ